MSIFMFVTWILRLNHFRGYVTFSTFLSQKFVRILKLGFYHFRRVILRRRSTNPFREKKKVILKIQMLFVVRSWEWSSRVVICQVEMSIRKKFKRVDKLLWKKTSFKKYVNLWWLFAHRSKFRSERFWLECSWLLWKLH